MRTVGRFAEGVLEAGWLAAAVLLPLFLDKNGDQVFDGAKAGLLRAIALLMLGAWAASTLLRRTGAGDESRSARRVAAEPLVLAGLGFLLLTMLASAVSLFPAESFWGHRGRMEGTITLGAELLIALAVVVELSSSAQLRRLVSALILPSVPIAVYALLQRLGYEPLQVTERQTELERATSFLGQPVFLAGYLAMILPFAAARAREAWLARRRALASAYGAVVLVQLAALLATESRGPVLALGVAAALVALAHAARRGQKKLVLALWALLAGAAVLVALGYPGRLARDGEGRLAQRASDIVEVSGGGGQFRSTSWSIATRVLQNRAPIERSDGRVDDHPGLRRLLGYGPETQYAVAPRFYDAELPQLFGYFLIDRFHNQLWDVLLTRGALGLLAWLAVQVCMLWTLAHGLGFTDTSRRRRTFFGLLALGGGLGALGWGIARGVPFVFLGLQTGALAGLALFLSVLAWQKLEAPPRHEPWLLAVLAALSAHLVETSFSFAVVVTSALMWLLAALALRLTRGPLREDEPARGEEMLLAWVLLALGVAFVGAGAPSRYLGTALWDALTYLAPPAQGRFPVGLSCVVASVLGALVVMIGAGARPLGRKLAVASALGLACWLYFALRFGNLVEPMRGNAEILARNFDVRTGNTLGFYLFALGIALAFAWLREPPHATIAKPLPGWRMPAALACGVLALALVPTLSLRPAYAETAVALGHSFKAQGKLELSELAYERAVALQPDADIYRAQLAKLLVRRATAQPSERTLWLERAATALDEAIARNPISSENAVNLAVVTAQRALALPKAERARLIPLLHEHFARALRLAPLDPSVTRVWANVQLRVFDRPDVAVELARRAQELDARSAAGFALLAECQVASARKQRGDEKRASMLAAASSYQQAAALAPAEPSHRINEGKALLSAGQPDKAVVSLRAALASLPRASREHEATLALLQRAESETSLVSVPEASR